MTTPAIEVFESASADVTEVTSGDVSILIEPQVVIELINPTAASVSLGTIELPATTPVVLSTELSIADIVEFAAPSVAIVTPTQAIADTVEVIVPGPQGIQGATGRTGIFIQPAAPVSPQVNDIWIVTPS